MVSVVLPSVVISGLSRKNIVIFRELAKHDTHQMLRDRVNIR